MKLRLPSLKEKPQTKQEKKKKKHTIPIEVDDIEIGEEVFDDAPEFTDIGKLDYSYEPIKVEHESKFQRINQVSLPTVRLPKQKKKKQTASTHLARRQLIILPMLLRQSHSLVHLHQSGLQNFLNSRGSRQEFSV